MAALTHCRPAAAPAVGTSSLSHPSALAFQGVTVVDVTDGRLRPDQTVVVRGTRIRAVGPRARVSLPRGAQVVDARGKYLMPGLWDMHIHVMGFPEVFYPLLIANGVTGIRDMGTPVPLDTVQLWRQEIAKGIRIGPRQINAGNPISDNDEGYCRTYPYPLHCPFHGREPFHLGAPTPERARYLVDSLKAAGTDLIKTYMDSREIYFAVAAEARRIGIPFGGHLPGLGRNVLILEAADSGQRTFEHMQGIGLQCPGSPSAVDTAGWNRCFADVAARLRRHNAWMVAGPWSAVPADVRTWHEFRARLRYWPDSVTRDGWLRDSAAANPSVELPRASKDAENRDFWAAAYRVHLPVLAGTDAASILSGDVPGFSLQDIVMAFAEAGLPPLEALQTATLNPAKYLEATDSLGTVAAGKLADLVLLDANPLEDIHHLRQIRAVVANGRYFDRAALDRLLADVAQRGASHWAR